MALEPELVIPVYPNKPPHARVQTGRGEEYSENYSAVYFALT